MNVRLVGSEFRSLAKSSPVSPAPADDDTPTIPAVDDDAEVEVDAEALHEL